MATVMLRDQEEELYRLLTEGSELLQRGAVTEARATIERALEIDPRHEQALNLLGLALFRLNRFDHARLIFGDLVNNNPVEPSLRLNLAMVHLKTGRLDEARRELEQVLSLSPEHPRATSYMGLVLEKKGALDEAARFFEKTQSKPRAGDVDVHRPTATGTFPLPHLQKWTWQADARAEQSANHANQAHRATHIPLAAVPAPRVPQALPTSLPPLSDDAVTESSQPAGTEPPPPSDVSPRPWHARRGDDPRASASRDHARKGPTPQESALKESTLADLRAAAAQVTVPTVRDDGLLAFPVTTVSYVRSDLVVGIAGTLSFDAVHRRYRGKRTDSLFGGAEQALVALSGRGVALLHAEKLALCSLALANEELYLVESALLGFTDGLAWENGRLPSDADRDLDVVHLRGTGRLVFGTRASVATITATPDAPAVVHASRLVGWSGQLVPHRLPLPGLPDAARRVPVVRFEGSGLVLAV